MLLVLIAKTVHRELAFAGIERKVAAERVDVQVAINLADTAVALIDADSGESRECESELDRATVTRAVVGRKFVLSGIELGLIHNWMCGGFRRKRVGHDTSREAKRDTASSNFMLECNLHTEAGQALESRLGSLPLLTG